MAIRGKCLVAKAEILHFVQNDNIETFCC